MLDLTRFPRGLPVRYARTAQGSFWFLGLPDGRILWGIEDEILGIERNVESVIYLIRSHKTGFLAWDRKGNIDALPALQNWSHSTGAGDFKLRSQAARFASVN